MEMEISEKVQRLTRILSEEAGKFPRVTVDQYSTGAYGYNWKVYMDKERQLGTIAFTTEVHALRERTPGSIPARVESAGPESGGGSGFGNERRCPLAEFFRGSGRTIQTKHRCGWSILLLGTLSVAGCSEGLSCLSRI